MLYLMISSMPCGGATRRPSKPAEEQGAYVMVSSRASVLAQTTLVETERTDDPPEEEAKPAPDYQI